MQAIFSGLLFIISIYFTIKGFEYDYKNNSGQVGPGFFPIWIGALLIIFTGLALIKDIRHQILIKKGSFSKPLYVKTILSILVATVLFIALMNILGAVIAMVLYVFAVLFVLNRERLILNTIISITVPISTYLLLDVWLNAGFPSGIFNF